MFYQLLHAGCILKTLPGRFGFLFSYQRFSSSDPINQCAAPGFRHGERGPVVLMLNVYFFFSLPFSFPFFSPIHLRLSRTCSHLSSKLIGSAHGDEFSNEVKHEISATEILMISLAPTKEKKKKGCRFKSIVEFRLSYCVQTGGSDFSTAASLATTIFCRNDQFC